MNCVDECSDDEFFIGCITSVNSVDTSEWCENLKIEDKVVKVQLDTGFCKTLLLATPATKGVVTLPCECKGNTFQVNFHVVETEAPTILGAQTCKDLSLLARVHLPQQQSLNVS